MSETTLQWIQFLKLILLAFYSLLYGFGGMNGKWKRRYVAPFILTAGIVGLSIWSEMFSYWYLGYFALLSAALHIGYGSSDFWVKVRKRTLYGLALGVSALPIAIGTGAWSLFGLHCGICIVVCVALGVFNITSSARAEETVMAAATAMMPLFMF